jgi:hypothetical protein
MFCLSCCTQLQRSDPELVGAIASTGGRSNWSSLPAVKKHVLMRGAGFGGLELATRLSETIPDAVRVTLLDRNDAFFFGFSKLEEDRLAKESNLSMTVSTE